MGKKSRTKVPKSTRKYVRKALDEDGEDKHFQINQSSVTISNTPTVVYLSEVTQSAGAAQSDETRIGDEIKPKSLEIRGFMFPSSANNPEIVRLMVVRWKPISSNASSPVTLGDILHDATATDAIKSPHNHDKRKNYDVLADRTLVLDSAAKQAYTPFVVKLGAKKMKKLFFQSGGITANNHLVCIITGIRSTDLSTYHFMSRLIYKDK